MKKMERPRRNTTSSSNSSGFRLLDDHCDTVSSVSRNSIYKLKIDAMFDDTRYFYSNYLLFLQMNRNQTKKLQRKTFQFVFLDRCWANELTTWIRQSIDIVAVRDNLFRAVSVRRAAAVFAIVAEATAFEAIAFEVTAFAAHRRILIVAQAIAKVPAEEPIRTVHRRVFIIVEIQ